jgi:hypothetical protein
MLRRLTYIHHPAIAGEVLQALREAGGRSSTRLRSHAEATRRSRKLLPKAAQPRPLGTQSIFRREPSSSTKQMMEALKLKSSAELIHFAIAKSQTSSIVAT